MDFVGAKLYMRKAYDRVGWNYVFRVIEVMGFQVKIIKIVAIWMSTRHGQGSNSKSESN